MKCLIARVAVVFSIAAFCSPSFGEEKEKTKEPVKIVKIERDRRLIDGFTVKIDRSLLYGDHEKLGQMTLRLLRADFARIELVVPPEIVKKWREVKIIVDQNHPLKGMQYHPSRSWLENKGYEGDLEKCVHIPKAGGYANSEHYFVQPCTMIHELAHAYHDQFLDFEHPKIKAAFARAQLEGQYKSVLFVKGGKRKHYALTNHKEYFAEATEAWFGQNDFYPFVRGELQEHDPKLYTLFKDEIWK